MSECLESLRALQSLLAGAPVPEGVQKLGLERVGDLLAGEPPRDLPRLAQLLQVRPAAVTTRDVLFEPISIRLRERTLEVVGHQPDDVPALHDR